jgi:hypothetical protein
MIFPSLGGLVAELSCKISAMNSTQQSLLQRLSTCFLCVIAMPVSVLAQSDVHPYLEDGFIVNVGAFLPRTDVDLGVDGTLTGPHPPVDFEGRIGNKREDSIFAAELIWRFGNKWSFRGQYFAGGRDAAAVLEEDIEWGDAVFEEGSFIGAGTDIEVARLFFARDFSASPQHEFGFGLGFHRLEIGGYLTGTAIINGETFMAETRSVSAVAPLPNIGGWYAYSPSEKWIFDARLDWLEAEIGDYGGGLLNAAAGVNYQAFSHFGIGLKYQIFHLNLDVNKPNWHGDFELTYQGLYLFLSANWH